MLTLNLRWQAWVRQPEQLWPDNPHGLHPAPLYLNFLVLVFFGSIGLAGWLERRLVGSDRPDKDGPAMATAR